MASKWPHLEDCCRNVFIQYISTSPSFPLPFSFTLHPLPPALMVTSLECLFVPKSLRIHWEQRGGDTSHKQRRKKKKGPHGGRAQRVWLAARSSAEAPVWCPRAGKWPSLAVTCLWLMSTAQWFGWRRLQPCSEALSLCSVRVLSRPWQTRQDSRRVEPR